ncbi:hypothetical protein TNIN_136291 [Trichonephila inaurata madagascariensis]|uniref:Uncharacterized protein n=1 Tax=Trichonephila inaurata madagascariensis TaxID=2747483 RepID=A0A8X6M595_9ARAC|nr:hypothetical protein TNIN_136291 [Trichonephila inaurata madagascariensis]
MEARPTFPDVRGQVEDIIWEIERRKTSLLSFTQPETGATLHAFTSVINFNGRSLTGLTLSVPCKGLSVCLNVPRTSSTASEALVCRLKHQRRAKVLKANIWMSS